ncbi:AcrR family transcriptional regulator [Caulobacter ginsengisoli]|uniref:AcrR family transcriptional regulator n=1 Tax=Caulobacter ginsengisoli TaxID=400775 RepID=A0ABU0IRA4_9CAUL|nr:TetR/AcrR family transcriptional regulator [Caulobacter ginsengisoli]MDQ0463529.1 AcrR family transcriptional regulator [Caulobacter ginsengisoli]
MQAPATKKPRASLTRDGIESAALQLIEQDGLEAFSTRKLAQMLGCEAMSIYHHFPSKAHLLDALVDRVVSDLPAPQPPAPWRERLTRMAQDFRAMAHRHPVFFRYMATHRMNTPAGLRWLDGALAAFREAGLSEEDAVRLFRGFGYYIIGGALDETSGYAKGPSALNPPSNEEVARDYPNVAAAGRWFAPGERDATFELGLNILLDGVTARRR